MRKFKKVIERKCYFLVTFYSQYTKPQQKNIVKILEKSNIKTYEDLVQEKNKVIRSKNWLKTAQILCMFPKVWQKALTKAKNPTYKMSYKFSIKLNIWRDMSLITTKQIR